MDNKKLLIIAIVIDVFFLAAAGYFYSDAQSQGELIGALTEERDAALAKVSSLNDDIRTLKNRIAMIAGNGDSADATAISRLNKSLDEKDAEISRLKKLLESASNNSTQFEENRRANRQRRGNADERMARLKEENPERYEQIMAQIEKRKQEALARTEKRNTYLNNLNTSKLNSEQQQVVSDYKALLKTNEELRAQMQQGADMSNFREVMRNQMEINQLSDSVRDILIEQYAGSNVADEIKNIIDATQTDGPRGGFGGPPEGFGGPRGDFGGPQR